MECFSGFPGDSVVNNLPAHSGDSVQSLGREDPLEKGVTIHSSILTWGIPWAEKPGGLYSSWGRKGVKHDLATKQQYHEVLFTYSFHIYYFILVFEYICALANLFFYK